MKHNGSMRGGPRAAACALACALGAAAASAQTAPVTMDEVLVTATRTERPLADTLPSATVITRREIEQSQSYGLIELLGRQAGVEFARTGGPGSQASVFLRGTNSSQTLVLVDGVRLNTALTGAAALGGVALDAIERIEIVRGNLSSLYGSEAVGGVIQIFTRRADRPGIEVGAEAGSGDTWIANAFAAGRSGDSSIALSAAARSSSPYSAIDAAQVIPGPFASGANPDDDGNRNVNGSVRAQGKVGPVDLSANLWGSRNKTDFDSTADGPAATHQETSSQRAMQANAAAQVAAGWRAQFTLARSDDDTTNESSVPWSFDNSEFDASNRSASLSLQGRLAESVQTSFAYEYLQQRGTSTAYDADVAGQSIGFTRRVNSLRAGLVADRGAHLLQANVRQDDYSDFGGETTGLLAYGYRFDPSWRVSAQLATAFRAPSFNDLYFPIFGNPALAPERAKSAEVALTYGSADASLRVGVFRNRVSDLIVYDPATQKAGNVADADIDGAELIATTNVDGWRLAADISYSRAVDSASGDRLLRRAPYKLHVAAARSFGAWEGLAELTHNAERYDLDINTFARSRLPGYTLARLALGWRATDLLRVTLRIENLFDAEYELVDGYNTPGFSIFAGVALRLL